MTFAVTYGDVPNETLPTPTLENDTFLGWYVDEEFNIPINSLQDDWNSLQPYAIYNIMPDECPEQTGNITLYAKWKSMDCRPIMDGNSSTTFMFETNGGNAVDKISICNTCGDAIEKFKNTTLPETIRDGYKFDGWYSDKDLTKKVESLTDENIIFEKVLDENGCSDGSSYTTLYAKWEKVTNVNVDSTGKSISIFLIVIPIIMIISGITMYIINIKKNEKN